MALGPKLKAARVRKGISLQKLADKVEVSKAYLWDVETERATNPSINLVGRIASALDTSISDLVGENPDAEGEQPEIATMYRELQDLNPEDRETIRLMIERFRKRAS